MVSLPHLPLRVALGLALASAGFAQPATPPLKLTLRQAIDRARQYGPSFLAANLAAASAHEDAVQAKAALLPSVSALSQFIYTQPNGTPGGVFVSNDGPHIYNQQALVHGDLYAPGKRADYHRALAAEAAARAKADVAERGLVAVVVQDYYAMAVAERKLDNTRQALGEARQFLDVTNNRSEAARRRTPTSSRRRFRWSSASATPRITNLRWTKPAWRSRFCYFRISARISPSRTIWTAWRPCHHSRRSRRWRGAIPICGRRKRRWSSKLTRSNPPARRCCLHSRSIISSASNANQFALHDPDHANNLGSVAQAQLTVPLWTWGAARSKIRQAQIGLDQARNDLGFTQRQLLSTLQAFYQEAQVAGSQMDSLKRSAELSAESLRLTLLRYGAGEVTVLEVVDAQTTLTQARNARADGLARYRLALAELQTLTGAF